jgi:gliding motility-associated-like protein
MVESIGTPSINQFIDMKLLTLIVFSLFCQKIIAQNFYNNGALISIKANTILSVYDSLVNNGEIINNGNLVMAGAWLNNKTYDAGQGQITFNSSDNQIINHNDQSFTKLIISGGGEKRFLANITITDQITLTNGILTSANGAKIIFKETAQITGGSDASHIRGPVYQQGVGDKLFPIGNGSVYLPVELKGISGSSPQIGITDVEITSTILKKSSSLMGISAARYWQIDKVSGSLDNARIILPVRGENVLLTDTQKAVVAQAQSLDSNFENIGQSFFDGTNSNGKITSDKAPTLPFVTLATAENIGLIVYNAVSPNGDGLNEFFRIDNIGKYPSNTVAIFNRWGDKVFEISNYDNDQRVFRGKSDSNKELVSGTYFYLINKNDGSEQVNGFLSLKRD